MILFKFFFISFFYSLFFFFVYMYQLKIQLRFEMLRPSTPSVSSAWPVFNLELSTFGLNNARWRTS